jgi:hypothetical protein
MYKMLRKNPLLLAATLALSASPAMAEVFIEGAVGASKASGECGGLYASGNCDNTGKVFRAGAGWSFNSWLALEGGYMNTGTITHVDTRGNRVANLNSRMAYGVTQFKLSFSPNFAGFLKLGGGQVMTKTNKPRDWTGTTSWQEAGSYIGFGVEGNLSNELKLRIEATEISTGVFEHKVRTLTVGLRHHF